MAPGNIGVLKRLLGEAQESASLIGDEPRAEPPGVGYLNDPDGSLSEAVEQVASHEGRIAMFVGAGVSTEAGLPLWSELTADLLEGVGGDLDDEERARWLGLASEEGPLASAAIAKALHSDDAEFRRALRRTLYRGRRPSDFKPGALAGQLAWLKGKLGPRLLLLTANYDGLLEAALREQGLDTVSYVRGKGEPEEKSAVWHLHGRLMLNPAGSKWLSEGELVLAEGDYARSSYATWPQQYVGERMKDSLCVFIGLSMTDPNFVRWLYRYGADSDFDHLAVFVRQSAPIGDGPVRRKLEEATAARWAQAGVRPIWTNYYGEVAQLVHEAGLRIAEPDASPFARRARARFECGRDLIVPDDPESLVEAQEDANRWLKDRLEGVRALFRAAGIQLDDEDLGLGLWAVDHERGLGVLWATSDHVVVDRDALEEWPLHAASRWVGIQAIMRGVVIEDDPAVYTTRWRFIRGIPVVVEPLGKRSIVGALTLTSSVPLVKSALSVERAPSGLLHEIDRMLAGSAAALFTA